MANKKEGIDLKIKYGLIIVAIFLVGATLYYYGFVLPNKAQPSYDLRWENTAQGLTYFCNKTDIVTCDVMECYTIGQALSSNKWCRGIGAPKITFQLHD